MFRQRSNRLSWCGDEATEYARKSLSPATSKSSEMYWPGRNSKLVPFAVSNSKCLVRLLVYQTLRRTAEWRRMLAGVRWKGAVRVDTFYLPFHLSVEMW